MIEKADTDFLLNYIRTIPDFPEPGIQFKDFTPLLGNKEALNKTSSLLVMPFKDEEVDYVAGLESRGFLLGPKLAQDLNAGFIPIRKPGKLPADTYSQKYELEYGSDSLEIHADALKKGDRVIIHDDLIATGGTVSAASKLVEKLGGIIVGFSFIMEIEFLNGTTSLDSSIPCRSLLKV